MRRAITSVTALLIPLLLAGIGCEAREEEDRRGVPAGVPAPAGELSEEELEEGIGPVDDVDLGPIDAGLAAQGEETFTSRCASCHRLDERYVGPPLRDVVDRREPEFIMNMILNPGEMVRRHPVVRQLLAQYYVEMPNQNLTVEEARAVLEYLRRANEEGAPAGS